MANLSGDKRAKYVQEMFTRIAFRYDLMNQIMTAGQDVYWRKWVIEKSRLPKNGKLLDLGAGTGDLAREAVHQHPGSFSLATDFTIEMMRVGKAREQDHPGTLFWAAADATRLPFPDNTFDAVVSGFLLRNVSELFGSLREQFRVLKPGGRIVSLDTTPPPNNLLNPFIKFYLHTVIPALGKMITGQAEAYQYLPDSTQRFLQPEQLVSRMLAAGFKQVKYQRLMFGAVAIHWARKPDPIE